MIQPRINARSTQISEPAVLQQQALPWSTDGMSVQSDAAAERSEGYVCSICTGLDQVCSFEDEVSLCCRESTCASSNRVSLRDGDVAERLGRKIGDRGEPGIDGVAIGGHPMTRSFERGQVSLFGQREFSQM